MFSSSQVDTILYSNTGIYETLSNEVKSPFKISIGTSIYALDNPIIAHLVIEALSANDLTAIENLLNGTAGPENYIYPGQCSSFENKDKSLSEVFVCVSSHKREPYIPSYPDVVPVIIQLKEQIMREILLAKFTQNPDMLKTLLDTRGRALVHTREFGNDIEYWESQVGSLSRLLMFIRAELECELDTDPNGIKVRKALSANLSTALKIHPSVQPAQHSYVTKEQLDEIGTERARAESNQQERSRRPSLVSIFNRQPNDTNPQQGEKKDKDKRCLVM